MQSSQEEKRQQIVPVFGIIKNHRQNYRIQRKRFVRKIQNMLFRRNISVSRIMKNTGMKIEKSEKKMLSEESIWNVLDLSPMNFEFFDDTFSCSNQNIDEKEKNIENKCEKLNKESKSEKKLLFKLQFPEFKKEERGNSI